MPKDPFGPKAIAKKLKVRYNMLLYSSYRIQGSLITNVHFHCFFILQAKGLQKLRFYCQVCQKQCRDDNGFKCHLTSESHRRQMALFAENPDKFMDEYSTEVSVVSLLLL